MPRQPRETVPKMKDLNVIELTEDQRKELSADPVRVLDPLTRKTYVLVSEV